MQINLALISFRSLVAVGLSVKEPADIYEGKHNCFGASPLIWELIDDSLGCFKWDCG